MKIKCSICQQERPPWVFPLGIIEVFTDEVVVFVDALIKCAACAKQLDEVSDVAITHFSVIKMLDSHRLCMVGDGDEPPEEETYSARIDFDPILTGDYSKLTGSLVLTCLQCSDEVGRPVEIPIELKRLFL